MTRARAIGVAQTVPVRGDVAANTAQHLQMIRAAADVGAVVLVFPELSLTGYELGLAAELALSMDDARLDPLVEAAVTRGMVLVVGAPVRIAARPRIGAFILTPEGVASVYTKQRLGTFGQGARIDLVEPGGELPPPEPTLFAPGDHDPLVQFGDQTAAVAICADTGNAAHAAAAAARGITSYLASMFVIPSEYDRETANLSSCAARHGIVVAMANFGGPSGGLASAGRSAIWSPSGELLVQLDVGGVGVAVAQVDGSGWRGRAIPVSG